MKDFHYVMEKGKIGAADYYEKKRETVLETIRPICEAFEINDYDYVITDNGGPYMKETLVVEGERLACSLNSIAATVRTLVTYIFRHL